MREGGVWTFEKKQKNSQPKGGGGEGEDVMVSNVFRFEF